VRLHETGTWNVRGTLHIPSDLVVGHVTASSKASRGEDLEIEQPVPGRHCASCHFPPPLAGVLGPTLRRDQVVEVCPSRQKRLLAPVWMMEPLHGEPCPLAGMMGLLQARTGHRPLGGCKDRRPGGFLVLQPASPPLAIGGSSRMRDMVRKAPPLLAARKPAPASSLSCLGQQGVQRRAQRLADRGRDGGEFRRELVARVAEAGAQARLGQQRPQTLGRAVAAIGEAPFHPVGGLQRERRALKLLLGLGTGSRTRILGVT
jgi:hypothetical protein